MVVIKWGNSLAVRLPASVVELLQLEEGDEIAIEIAGPRELHVRRDTHEQKALDQLRAQNWDLPAGFSLGRDGANER